MFWAESDSGVALTQTTAYGIVSSLCEKSEISLTECERPRGKSPWMAILGVSRHGCRRLRPDRFETPIYILLVKSDFKLRLETIPYAVVCVRATPLPDS
ncbi:MAG: hypothetical protein K2N55_05660, partial [Lachnospiraceae bacterium]|nr:hypothetical protein [Lachnospiraceae bacterium]